MIITNEVLGAMINQSIDYPLAECKIEKIDDLKFTFTPPDGTAEKVIEIDLWRDKCAFSLNNHSSLFDFSELDCMRDLIKSLKVYYGVYIDPLQEALNVKELKEGVSYQFYRGDEMNHFLSPYTVELVGSDFFMLNNGTKEKMYSYDELLKIIVLRQKPPKGFDRKELISICKSVRAPWRFYKDFSRIWTIYFDNSKNF
jgi:hypothetical protein